MGHWGRLRAASVAVLLVLGAGVDGLAAESFKIGVIDAQVVLEKTKAGKRALETLKEFTASRQKIISAEDEELKRLETELKEQESGLSEAMRREKQEAFRTKLQNYQRRLQDFNGEIQAKQKEMAEEYAKKINEAAAAVAQRGGYSVILDKGNDSTLRIVLYHRPSIDLTDQVIKEFDQRNK